MPIIFNLDKMDYQRRNAFMSDPLDAKRIDSVNSGLTYVGYTFPNVLDDDPNWLIKRISVDGTLTSVDYSNTGKTFDDMWNERTGYTYY